jgi:cell division protein FtsI/penicillin-binding protein 2
LARAYRALLMKAPRDGVVWRGLRDSVAFGMANNARVKGAEVLGKTGTANNAGEWWSHGWFAGAVPDRYVLVVYVPKGDGGVAATVAAQVFRGLLQDGAR